MDEQLRLLQRVEVLERKLRRQRSLLLAGMAAIGLFFLGNPVTAFNDDSPNVVRARGLIIEGADGKPRIMIGAPIPDLTGRQRRDSFTGILYLDENGHDRLTFGKKPDPQTAHGIVERRVGGVGILLHDKNGIERGAYGVLDDDVALLTLDWPQSGEALALSASPAMAGIGLFYRSEPGVYRDAIGMFTFVQDDRVLAKVTDAQGTERMILRGQGGEKPEFSGFSEQRNQP